MRFEDDQQFLREGYVIYIEMQAGGLAHVRFAISPLRAAVELLYFRQCVPHSVARQWRAEAGEILRDQKLELLEALVRAGTYGYMPDFVTPSPVSYESDPDAELHRVATTPPQRIAYEMTNLLIEDPPYSEGAARPSSPVLLAAIEVGEQEIAERLAHQLARFWHLALADRWPRIRADLEHDIGYRARTAAREGLAVMIDTLHPTLVWQRSGFQLDMTCGPVAARGQIAADAAILMPAAFGSRPLHSFDPPHAPHRRNPVISFPTIASAPAAPRPLNELIGSTRERILAALATPTTTGRLAEDLHLSPSTVSYHLHVLHRAGLISRIRRSRRVYYHAIRSW